MWLDQSRESETPLCEQSLILRNLKVAFSRIQFWAHKQSLESLFSLSMRPIYVKIGMELADVLNLKMVSRNFCFRSSFWDMAFSFEKVAKTTILILENL